MSSMLLHSHVIYSDATCYCARVHRVSKDALVIYVNDLRYCGRDMCFFFSSRRRHTRFDCDWSSDVCSSDLVATMRSVTKGQEAMRRKLRITMGVPFSSRNCLGVSAPMRVPMPAAGKMAAIRLMLEAASAYVPQRRIRKSLSLPQAGVRGECWSGW